ncbi:transmembrane signal receptor [Lithospermum erythrorhizon]|uniref:non-specific serine/threonine protein kinase n=1 Tax=Lithospermum erythrorhizon TaxID=34254 RepID=A0AAV3R192_LITER
MLPLISSLLTNSTLQTSDQNINFLNRTALYNPTSSRLRLTSSGVLQFYQNVTNRIWREPRYLCSVYNACGTYGNCKNINEQKKKCNCLEGFRPLDSEEWKSGRYTDGCRRKTEIACGRSSERDTFLHLNSVRLVQADLRFGYDFEVNCSDHCLGDCQCLAYSFFGANGRSGSIDNARSGCWIWKKDLRDLQEGIDGGRSLSVRISVSDLSSPSQHNKTTADEPGPKNSSHIKQRILIISTTVIAIVICILSYLFYRRNNCSNQRARTSTGNSGSLQPTVFITESQAKNTTEGNIRKSIDVSFFKFQTILVATDNFSEANKLGEGGFGPVYLGTFGDEQYLAVKRLSSHSGQGVEEFQNEVALIAKLQHRNLVRVLGYCVEKDERVLLYEYMPNKSLDMFIFNQKQSFSLDWRKRFDIILGIARGLLYLLA